MKLSYNLVLSKSNILGVASCFVLLFHFVSFLAWLMP